MGRRSRLSSGWQPPASSKVALDHRIAVRCLQDYTPYSFRPNLGHWDIRALKWLRQSKSVTVADVDKNLGDAVFTKNWIQSECTRLLSQAATPIAKAEYDAMTFSAQCAITDIVQHCSQ